MSIQSTVADVAKRISEIPRSDIREPLMFQLLTGARLIEVIGPKYTVTKQDLSFTNYKGIELCLITLKTAKHNGRKRLIALPTKNPWVKYLVQVFEDFQGESKVFNVSHGTIQNHCHQYFEGLTYLIEKYSMPNDWPVDEHNRIFVTHALRHLRYTLLYTVYGFTPNELSIYLGWVPPGYR